MLRADNASERGGRETVNAVISVITRELPLSDPPREELYRHLGYSKGAVPADRLSSRIEQVIAEAQSCIRPRGVFSLYSLGAHTPNSLSFGGCEIKGQVAEFMATAERIAVFVVTVGREITGRATKFGERGDALAQWILDAFGSWAAEAATDALMQRIRLHAAEGQELTLRYSPGYCGMGVDQQRTLFRMVQADAIGVKLLPSMLMFPLKSVSGIVGLGPKDAVSAYRAPCDYCDRVGCHMRR